MQILRRAVQSAFHRIGTRMRMARGVRIRLGLLWLLVAPICCGGQPIIILDVDASAVPAGFTMLLLHSALDGMPGQDTTFTPADQRVVVYLPDSASGNVD